MQNKNWFFKECSENNEIFDNVDERLNWFSCCVCAEWLSKSGVPATNQQTWSPRLTDQISVICVLLFVGFVSYLREKLVIFHRELAQKFEICRPSTCPIMVRWPLPPPSESLTAIENRTLFRKITRFDHRAKRVGQWTICWSKRVKMLTNWSNTLTIILWARVTPFWALLDDAKVRKSWKTMHTGILGQITFWPLCSLQGFSKRNGCALKQSSGWTDSQNMIIKVKHVQTCVFQTEVS